MKITAEQVKELRERTGAAMMDCKKALVETAGDMDKSIELLRKSGQAKADKKAGRIAGEGIIKIAANDNSVVILEINCETDFVARDENFASFANQIVNIALQHHINDVDKLLAAPYDKQQATVEEVRQGLVAKIGENINIRRIQYIKTDGIIGTYLHGSNSRIGVVVTLQNGDVALAKDIAMHIAASKPMVVDPQSIPAEFIDKEREIFMAQAQSSGKPKEIIEKMVEGRIKKYLDEVSLLGQPFVKDPETTVGKLLQSHKAMVQQFFRFEVGEGIEKPITNFAEEVMAQVKES